MNAQSALQPPTIELRGVVKRYGDRHLDTPAVGPIDVEISGGKFVSILGPSGCGKSTLLSMIASLVSPSGGAITIGGRTRVRPDRSRGVVFQEPALFPWRTVFENVSIALKADAIGRAERRERVLTQLERVGLAAFASHYPTQLSGGMKQRVMLARALAMGSRILLMDEPFAALDALTRETMQEQLLDLWQATGMTVIFVTHSIEEAVYLSQRVLVLSSRPGRIIEDCSVNAAHPRPYEFRSGTEMALLRTRLHGLLAGCAG